MVRILTDSSSDIRPHEAAALQLDLVPLGLTFETGETLRDGVDITSEEFYARLPGEAKLPKTSQPSMSAFMEVFENAKQAGDTMVAVLLGSGLSGTFHCARMAAEDVEYRDVIFVDTQNATLGQELLVRLALSLRDDGRTAEEIAETLECEKNRVRVLAVVNDLKYLHKGGRLSGAAAVVGGALGIKPVVTVKDGKITLAGKARGLPGAFVALFKLMEEQGGVDSGMPYVIGYADKKSMADPLCRYTQNNLGLGKPLYSHISPVVGTHTGPGVTGIAFFAKE